MNRFEAVILYSPDLSNLLIGKEEETFLKNFNSSEGKVISIEDWGLRELSYNIEKYKKAFYKFYQIEINGNKLKDIKRFLTQNEKILRHLFVKVKEHAQLPTKMSKDEEK